MLKYYLKYLALKTATVMVVLGLHKLLYRWYGGKGTILMFHRVIPKQNRSRIHNHLSLEITPEHLEKIILFFKKRDYNFISIDEIGDYIKGNKKFVVFTFDDGYIDNYTYAYPIFKRYNVPFTIYVCNDFPNNKAFIWWYYLEELLLNNNRIEISTKGFIFSADISSLLKKEKAFYKLRDAINKKELSIGDFKQLLDDNKVQLQGDDYFLNWSKIKELSEDSLFTIGAHTLTHPALRNIPGLDAIKEIEESRKEIQTFTGKRIKHFAYPFGSKKEVSLENIDQVKKLGFDTAVTTNLGNIFEDHKDYMCQLPRITINSQTSLSVLKMQLSGFYSLIRNKFKKVVL